MRVNAQSLVKDRMGWPVEALSETGRWWPRNTRATWLAVSLSVVLPQSTCHLPYVGSLLGAGTCCSTGFDDGRRPRWRRGTIRFELEHRVQMSSSSRSSVRPQPVEQASHTFCLEMLMNCLSDEGRPQPVRCLSSWSTCPGPS